MELSKQKHIKNCNLYQSSEEYVKQIVSISGIKALVFDSVTKIIFSLVTTKSIAVKEEIFLFEEITKVSKEKYLNVKGIFLLRPTESNIENMGKLLKQPIFSESYIFFTNTMPDEYLKRLAYADEYATVKSIQEIYLDYFIVNEKMFHFNIQSERNNNVNYENDKYDQIINGLFSICISNKAYPNIKIIKGSKDSLFISNKLQLKLLSEMDLINKNIGIEQNSTLIIYDRSEDPITPLLTQWTYQAMVHDNFQIIHNIVNVKKEKLVFSSKEDDFLNENKDKVFADVASIIKDKIDNISKDKNDDMQSFDDIKKYIENLPSKKKESMELTKHTSIIYELTNIVEDRKLLDISSLEQDISCKDEKKEQYNRLIEILKSNKIGNKQGVYSEQDKIKLCLLFLLRYESDELIISNLKQAMKENDLEDYTNILEDMIKYGGKSMRQCDLFGNKDFISQTLTKFSHVFKDVPNIFTQHTSLIYNLLKRLINKGKVTEFDNVSSVKSEKLNKIIVFCIGGATFEEMRDLNLLSFQSKVEIIYGGCYISNSNDFMMSISNKKYSNLD